MIGSLPRYGQMRESGFDWLGPVPEHWRVQSLGSLVRFRSERGRPELPLLSVVRERGVIPRLSMAEDENHNFIPDDLSNYKVVRAGDLVINKMKAWQGSLGIAPTDGIVSPAYFVLSFAMADSQYGHLLLRSRPYVAFFAQVSEGVRIGQWDLAVPGMKRIPVVIPPEAEQQAIVQFVAYADQRISRFIASKQKLIALLEEQRAAVVADRVTRGIRPVRESRVSDVEGLDEVPERWETRPLLRCCTERADYRGATPTKTESGVFLVTAKNIRKGWIDYEASAEYVDPAEYDTIMRRGKPRIGDLLFTTEAPLGHFALVDREDIALAQRVIRFRLDSALVLPEFALYATLSHYFQDQLTRRSTGSTARGIKASKLPQLRLLLPPLDEQREIADAIRNEIRPLEAARDRAIREVRVVREYRTRLVADLVTGKLDARSAAEAMPVSREGVSVDFMNGDGSRVDDTALDIVEETVA